MEYKRTLSLLHVMSVLGHRSWKNAQLYVDLSSISIGKDEFICEVAHNLQEATKLIENGFDYVTEMDGCKIFKRRK
jgi:hypothetical protein